MILLSSRLRKAVSRGWTMRCHIPKVREREMAACPGLTGRYPGNSEPMVAVPAVGRTRFSPRLNNRHRTRRRAAATPRAALPADLPRGRPRARPRQASRLVLWAVRPARQRGQGRWSTMLSKKLNLSSTAHPPSRDRASERADGVAAAVLAAIESQGE
jgi:hypothetical protein